MSPTEFALSGSFCISNKYVSRYSTPLKAITDDIDGDGALTNADIALAIRYYMGWDISENLGAEFDRYTYDLNCDGKVNNRDLIIAVVKYAVAVPEQ